MPVRERPITSYLEVGNLQAGWNKYKLKHDIYIVSYSSLEKYQKFRTCKRQLQDIVLIIGLSRDSSYQRLRGIPRGNHIERADPALAVSLWLWLLLMAETHTALCGDALGLGVSWTA